MRATKNGEVVAEGPLEMIGTHGYAADTIEMTGEDFQQLADKMYRTPQQAHMLCLQLAGRLRRRNGYAKN